MELIKFINTNHIKPADSLQIKSNTLGLIDTNLIYLGSKTSKPIFMANFIDGPRIIAASELREITHLIVRASIHRFIGNDLQRRAAVQRAFNIGDSESFHIIKNNCKHLFNYSKSKNQDSETSIVGAGLTLGGIALAASSRNGVGRNIGLVVAILGLIALATSDND